MPGKHQPPLVLLRGEEPYGKYLDRLAAEARKRGHTTRSERSSVVELACNLLGARWGLVAPRRARPLGSNQHDRTENGPPRA